MPEEIPASTATTANITVGLLTMASIETAGDSDWFRIALQGYREYRIDLEGADTGRGTLADPFLNGVYDAGGSFIPDTWDDDSGTGLNSELIFRSNAGGIYYIAATAFGGATGFYSLTVTDLGGFDDFGGDITSTGIIGSDGIATGTIEAEADQDWFAAALLAGHGYRISLLGVANGGGTLADPYLRGIYDATGALLAGTTNDDAGGTLDSQVTFNPSTSGSYFIAAGGFGQATGTYRLELVDLGGVDDFAAIPATTGVITAGGTATGLIETATDNDWFAATLVAGNAYRINLQGAGSNLGTLVDPYLVGIFDGSSTLIPATSNDDGGGALESRLDYVAATSGTHYIAASGYGPATGSYRVSLTDLGPRDDFAAGFATAGQVTVGGSTTGTIETAGDEDWFAVTLAAGQVYRIDLAGSATASGTLADPYLHGLFTATGVAIAGTIDDDGGEGLNSQLTYVAQTSGTYFVAASGFGAGIGTYQVSVTGLGPADDFTATTATTGQVAVNGGTTGNIEVAGDEDWFSSTLAAGTTYRIRLEGISGTGVGLADPYLGGLTTSVGVAIANTSNDDGGGGLNSQLDFTATASGTHFIAARGLGPVTGAYRLSVEALQRVDDFAATMATTGAVAIGGRVTGSVDSFGDHDWFGMALTAGDTYRLDLIGIDGGGGSLGDTYLYGVRNAAGVMIAGTNDDDSGEGRSSRVDFVAPTTGTYYADAGAYGVFTGTYSLALTRLARADDFAATTATTGRVTPGGSASGDVEAAGDRDWFAVTLAAGGTYRVDVEGGPSSAGTLADPYLYGVYNAAGLLLPGTTDDDGGTGANSQTSFIAATAGTYYVGAGGYGTNTGSYKISVTTLALADDFLATTATTGRVTVGGAASGVIETADDNDWFAVTLTGGTLYRIDLEGSSTGNGTLADPLLRGVYGANGGERFVGTYTDDGGVGLNSQLDIAITTTGTYFLAASSTANRTGSYKLSVTSLGSSSQIDDFAANITSAGRITVGGSATGRIDLPGDEDWFAVSLTAGQSYRIDLEGAQTNAGTLINPYLRGIHYPAGVLAIPGTEIDDGGNGLNASLTFTPSTSGTLWVAAGAAGSGLGTYKLSVSTVPATPPPPAYDIQVNYTGDAAYRQYFERAAQIWESIIVADVPDVRDLFNGYVDDLKIDASVSPIDGVGGILGQAGARASRASGYLPYLGAMTFDSADMANMLEKGTLQSVVLHEMGHVLGLNGYTWGLLGLVNTSTFIGDNAVREYATLSGISDRAVPLETGGGTGTAGSHWSEAVFGRELMTGYTENSPPQPLSRLTIGALQDLGYAVNYGRAEAYALPGASSSIQAPAAFIQAAPEGVALLVSEGFAGAQLSFFDEKPIELGTTPAVAKLDGQVISADGTTVLFFESTLGNGYLVELVGDFVRNTPTTAGDVKGTLAIMRVFSIGQPVATYDFSNDPRDVQTVLDDYRNAPLTGAVLIESRAASAQDDTIAGADGNDMLIGALGNDRLIGNDGNDSLDGGGGADVMQGGRGNDTYVVDSTGDQVSEAGSDGRDMVQAFITYTLPTGVEELLLAPGTGGLFGIGNTLANAITGNEAVNALYGAAGNDTLAGGEGTDYLYGQADNDSLAGGTSNDMLAGEAGNDTLDGGANPLGLGDVLLGGAGSDLYLVDSALDFVDEGNFAAYAGYGFGGNDTIISSANFFWDLYSIGEELRIAEDAADPLGVGTTIVGSVFSNALVGNSHNNILFGRGGSDSYRAGDGIDYMSLSTLGVTNVGSYVANGVNTVIVDPHTSGPVSWDIVFEYEPGRDRIDVSAYHYASAAAVLARGSNAGANCFFTLGDGLDILYLVNVQTAQLSAADFIL